MEMIIRIAKNKDSEGLSNIDNIAHKEFDWWIPKDKRFFNKFINNKLNMILISEYNERIIGYLGLEYNKDRKSTWLNELYIIKEMRRYGVARELVNLGLWESKSKSIVLLTADNKIKIFDKMGFKKTMNFMEYKK